MKIYSITATFGKLEHETLTLKPGLNIIEAPNEWGKSTWCAFLAAMFYGLDTRAKSTKTALADKERYAPWSGSPMAGRIDLNWNGRDITIERKTRGRTPLGDFRAYETENGLAVPELTSVNCGQMLLGVERSVFLRSAFIRLSDLPVTNDEALRRRLNALVTTGDESSAGDRLSRGLKELKNHCRYNRTGLIPQAEEMRASLEGKLAELDGLQRQVNKLCKRLEDMDRWIESLENHRDTLAYHAAKQDEDRVLEARRLRDEAAACLDEANRNCEGLPQREQIRQTLDAIQKLEEAWQSLQMEEQMLQPPAEPIEMPGFAGMMEPEDLLQQVKADADLYRAAVKKTPVWLLVSLLLVAVGGILACWFLVPGLILLGVGAVILAETLISRNKKKKTVRKLQRRYGGDDPDSWIAQTERYAAAVEAARETARQQTEIRLDWKSRRDALEAAMHQATDGRPLGQCRQDWENALRSWDALADAGRDYQKAEHHYQALKSMAKQAVRPTMPDELTYSEGETARLLSDASAEKTLLQSRISQYEGRMEVLGDPNQLTQQLALVNERIQKLEQTYAALTIAQETLAQARQELQRRFAPRIAKRARELMGILTDGRYDRLQLAEDLSLLAGAESEDTLREILWRSDGTVDQLYLALRLAVSEALAPEAPLILDDALVRFDDTRLKAALKLLQTQAETRQVILFSCQSREKNML